jgi:hypothetical protein
MKLLKGTETLLQLLSSLSENLEMETFRVGCA